MVAGTGGRAGLSVDDFIDAVADAGAVVDVDAANAAAAVDEDEDEEEEGAFAGAGAASFAGAVDAAAGPSSLPAVQSTAAATSVGAVDMVSPDAAAAEMGTGQTGAALVSVGGLLSAMRGGDAMGVEETDTVVDDAHEGGGGRAGLAGPACPADVDDVDVGVVAAAAAATAAAAVVDEDEGARDDDVGPEDGVAATAAATVWADEAVVRAGGTGNAELALTPATLSSSFCTDQALYGWRRAGAHKVAARLCGGNVEGSKGGFQLCACRCIVWFIYM